MSNFADSTSNTSDSPDLFYFESDHLALRNNKDYSDVIQTLVVLCAQRERAIKDYNTCIEMKKEALENPDQVIEKIMKGDHFGLPDIFQMPKLPNINWNQYHVKVPRAILQFIYTNSSEENDNVVKVQQQPIKKNEKRNTNRWTIEEQKRLEELLEIYPPEPIGLRRSKKIAEALGTRTIQQVTSRIQKYFLKLDKAGLPVPGRKPKRKATYMQPTHKHQRHKNIFVKPTTFFPNFCVPLEMGDTSGVPGPSTKHKLATLSDTSDNYLLPNSYSNLPKNSSERSLLGLQLDLVKRIKNVKNLENSSKVALCSHTGYKCNYCQEEPIEGIRWHCATCRTVSINFCTDCMLTQMYSDEAHSFRHTYECIPSDSTFSGSQYSEDDEKCATFDAPLSYSDVSNSPINTPMDTSSEDDDSNMSERINDDLENKIERQWTDNAFSTVNGAEFHTTTYNEWDEHNYTGDDSNKQ